MECRNIQIIETDVTSFESQATAFKAAYDVFNGLDIVIPCAGLMGQSLLDDIRVSGEELPNAPVRPSMTVLNVNLTGVYFSTALALHYFALDARKGAVNGSKHLLLISSAMAYMPAPLHSAYDASKWGVRGLWKSLKDDNQERTSWFRTNLIAPTLTRTPMTEAFCEFLAAKGFGVCQPSDVIRAGMRLIYDKTIVGRAVLPLPGAEAADLCDDFEGFDGGQESLRILESGKVGEGPKELGMFRIG
jgi:5'-hydroxyaverantin dehydrogenase